MEHQQARAVTRMWLDKAQPEGLTRDQAYALVTRTLEGLVPADAAGELVTVGGETVIAAVSGELLFLIKADAHANEPRATTEVVPVDRRAARSTIRQRWLPGDGFRAAVVVSEWTVDVGDKRLEYSTEAWLEASPEEPDRSELGQRFLAALQAALGWGPA